MPTSVSNRQPSKTLKADRYWIQHWQNGAISLPEAERRAQGSLRLRDAYSSKSWYAKKAAQDPDYWSKFYASRINF